ncbi:MAG TPA: TonB-dependent receptor [Candidatus Sulfotelmatobacter sp.]|nr:TonB-dependent receptor [Candidatus Sulfotelmatobacter sp.]
MKRVVFVCFFVMLLLPAFLSAQDVASLTGVVTDKTGAVVIDASVRLLDTKTNQSYVTKTNTVGAYTFPNVLPGPDYTVTFTKEGFTSLTVSGVYLAVGITHTQNAQLQVGQRNDTVEVNGEGASVTLNTTDNSIGNNFDMQLVHELPILVRDNPTSLLLYEPGVVNVSTVDDPSGNRVGSVTGARADQGSYSLDGLDINDYAIGQPFATVAQAPVDSIQEIRGETANPLSSEGRGSGAQLQLVTKSGTNQWHGSIYEYHRDTATEANLWFNNLNGVPRPALIRNQFGGTLGGPIIKNKLFFFFNYEGRRDASQTPVEWVVPLNSFRNGLISYINNGASCSPASRQDTQPSCITSLNSTQVQTMIDAQNPGVTFPAVNNALLSFINSRYPAANDIANFGDGVNTGGYLTNIRTPQAPNLYVGRIDYNISPSQKLFGRFSIRREVDGDNVNFLAPSVFPGDPLTRTLENKDYAYVIGHTWTITNNIVNQFIYGETRQIFATPSVYNPLGLTDYNSPGGTSLFGNISAPYLTQSGQYRHIPVPEFKDDFTYVRGGHTFQVGATFKPISVLSSLGNSYNYTQLGLGGAFLPQLDANARPSDILSGSAVDPSALANQLWDQALPFYIGKYAEVFTNYNYTGQLQAQAIGTPSVRHYRANETELYLQDNWKARSDLNLSFGLRYIYYSVPYETNGLEAISNTNFAGYIAPRIQSGLEGAGACYYPMAGAPAPLGISQCGATIPAGNPVTSFVLGGKANHGPGYYHPDWRDFAPRFAFAYNPSFTDGFLQRVFGDRKTVIRGGAGIVYDHAAVNSVQFVQNQVAAVFVNSETANLPLGGSGSSAAATLAGGPFFSAVGEVPAGLPSAPSVTVPYTPYTDFVGSGVVNNSLNDAFDPNFKTPYSELLSFGIQREMPDHFQLDVNFFARLGRRLMAAADAGELRDFKDPTSGQLMSQAFIGLAQDLRAGNNPAAQPFFDNLVTDPFGLTGTQLIADLLTAPAARSDMGSSVFALEGAGFMPFGIGFNPQYVYDIFYTNKSASNYDGLLTTLHRKFAQGLQFDLNYTYSHSIDNNSAIANNVFGEAANFSGGILCDPINLRVCRGNSDFDIRHQISADGLYNLPFGKGRYFASGAPVWLDRVIGGWQLAGDLSWHSGLAFTTVANAFPLSFDENVPAIFNGDTSALKVNVHKDPSSGRIQLFADPNAALAAFSEPLGFQAGSRNNLRGPRFSDVDLALNKHFPIRDRLNLEFRAEAFNVFNHPSFGLPGGNGGAVSTADISNPAQFGVITQTAGTPRIMQFALRLEF